MSGSLSRQPWKPRPFRPLHGSVQNVVFGRGTVLDNGLIGPKPASRVSLEADEGVPDPNAAQDALYAANCLQLDRRQPVEALSLHIALECVHDGLPRAARAVCGLAMTAPTQIFSRGVSRQSFRRRANRMYHRYERFWRVFANAKWIFWPIEAEAGHFVTVIFVMDDLEPNDNDRTQPRQPYTRVKAWSIVDPCRTANGRRRLRELRHRVTWVLERRGYPLERDTFHEWTDRGTRHKWGSPWVPPQIPDDDRRDTWSGGIRCFALVRQLWLRAASELCRQPAPPARAPPDERAVNARIPDGARVLFGGAAAVAGHLNVDRARLDMAALCALRACADLGWRARLAVECVGPRLDGVAGRRGGGVDAAALAPDDDDWAPYEPGTEDVAACADADPSSSSSGEDEDDDDDGDEGVPVVEEDEEEEYEEVAEGIEVLRTRRRG
ncbi:hypothetical protein GGR56DRAFT_686131 [Xylariaceae sp. FL0804]|nr:hypothetical protein GGR56DRAFT_686131 [Xylariaceae sp. FL0804]